MSSKGPTLIDAKEEKVLVTIRVNYRFTEGYHVCTSDDVKGLYVASKSPERAHEAVGEVLRELISRQVGAECSVRPTQSFDEWLRANRAMQQPQQTLRNRDFIVLCDEVARAA